MKDKGRFEGRGPCVYFDTSSKGGAKRHKRWRAERGGAVTGRRQRKRFDTEAEAWAWVRGAETPREKDAAPHHNS